MKALRTIIMAILMSPPVLATPKNAPSAPVISLEKMQLSYLDGVGALEVLNFKLSRKNFEYQGVEKKFDLFKEGPLFHLENPDNRFSLGPFTSRSLDQLGMMDLKDFSFFYREGSRLAFHTYHLHLEVGEGIQQLLKMQWDCQAKTVQDHWAKICAESLVASIKEVQLAQESEKTLRPLAQFIFSEYHAGDSLAASSSKAPKKIENIFIKILQGQTAISLQARYLFNWTLKMEGVSRVTEQNDRLVFRLDKAKVGFLSVRGKVLELIENAGLKNVQRHGNEIHLLF